MPARFINLLKILVASAICFGLLRSTIVLKQWRFSTALEFERFRCSAMVGMTGPIGVATYGSQLKSCSLAARRLTHAKSERQTEPEALVLMFRMFGFVCHGLSPSHPEIWMRWGKARVPKGVGSNKNVSFRCWSALYNGHRTAHIKLAMQYFYYHPGNKLDGNLQPPKICFAYGGDAILRIDRI